MLIILIIAVNVIVSLLGFQAMKRGNAEKFLYILTMLPREKG